MHAITLEITIKSRLQNGYNTDRRKLREEGQLHSATVFLKLLGLIMHSSSRKHEKKTARGRWEQILLLSSTVGQEMFFLTLLSLREITRAWCVPSGGCHLSWWRFRFVLDGKFESGFIRNQGQHVILFIVKAQLCVYILSSRFLICPAVNIECVQISYAHIWTFCLSLSSFEMRRRNFSQKGYAWIVTRLNWCKGFCYPLSDLLILTCFAIRTDD